jgi:hypothetical protein
MVAWSYSSIKTFEQCPKKYYHLKVAKDVKDSGTEATDYGQEAHKAAEEYIKFGKPFPAQFKFMEPSVQALNAIPGDKHCELKLGVRKTTDGYEPCDFFSKDVWWRGIADLIVVSDEQAFVVDYKTGKNTKYADTKQLDLLAGAVFVHFPKVKKIKSALLYVVTEELIKTKEPHVVGKHGEYLSVFDPVLDRLDMAHLSGVWNAKTSGLCGWCPVTTCEHFRSKR